MATKSLRTDTYLDTLQAAFAAPQYQSFHWTAGEPAALMVHGFLGTPLEMRALGQALFDAGWTVHAPLLPGFGPDIGALFEVTSNDWLRAIRKALASLEQQHTPILLIGHSMGGGLAMQVAAQASPTALVLISPFTQLPIENAWLRLLSPLLHHLIRRVRLFTYMDPSRAEIREGVQTFIPDLDLDLDDPEVQHQLRQMVIPTQIISHLQRTGKLALNAAPKVTAPTLIFQGQADEVALPKLTRQLLTRLAGPVTYHEVPGEHNLMYPRSPSWQKVRAGVLTLAQELTPTNPTAIRYPDAAKAGA